MHKSIVMGALSGEIWEGEVVADMARRAIRQERDLPQSPATA